MGQYVAPLRDMQFVLHEFLNVTEEFKNLPAYQEIDADIINQVLEEGAKFTQEVLFPLNHSGDREGSTAPETGGRSHDASPIDPAPPGTVFIHFFSRVTQRLLQHSITPARHFCGRRNPCATSKSSYWPMCCRLACKSIDA